MSVGLRLAVIGVALVVVACGARQRSSAVPIDRRVAAIELVGASAFSRKALVRPLATERARRSGQPFEPAQAREDRRRLLSHYVRGGYFEASVDSDVASGPRGVTVRFRIVEGRRATLAGVQITGLPSDLGRDEVRAAIELEDGAPFDYDHYDRAKPKLVELLDDHGYAHGRVEALVVADRVAATATVQLRFEPGPKTVIGPVRVHGVDGDVAGAVRARLGLREGAPYSSRALTAAQNAVAEMGARILSVRVEPDRSTESASVPIVVTVVEAPRHELRAGGGVGLDPVGFQVRGRIGYSIAGFPEELTTSRVELRPAVVLPREDGGLEPRVQATAGLERLDLLRPRLLGEVEVGYAYETFEAYTSRGPRVRLGLRSPIIGTRVSAAIGWQLRLLQFPEIDEAVVPLAAELGIPAEDDWYRLGYYHQALIVDLRDDPVAPRVGGYGELQLEEGHRAAGGAIDYIKVIGDLRGYIGVPRVRLAGRARLGTITGDVPVTQRFFAGGAYSQRGFPDRRLAPTATTLIDDELHSAPYGGGALIEAGAELRVRLGSIGRVRIDAAGFVDGADVTERPGQLDPANLHWATGGGLRVPTPVGAVRVDVGVRLNRYGAGELRPGERLAYHLSVGEAF